MKAKAVPTAKQESPVALAIYTGDLVKQMPHAVGSGSLWIVLISKGFRQCMMGFRPPPTAICSNNYNTNAIHVVLGVRSYAFV